MEKYFTQEGFEKLKRELSYLKIVKRREIGERLARCISYGDLTENAEYHETKEAQGFLEGRILELENLIENAVIAPLEKKKGLAQIGSNILVKTGREKERFKIVGAEEASPLDGKISIDSPLGRALLNQSKGVIVEVPTPEGKLQYKILKID